MEQPMNGVEARVHGIRSSAQREKALISQLDSLLSDLRTPQMKRQLKHRLENVIAVEVFLRFARNAERRYSDAWLNLAELNVRTATDLRQCIQKLIDVYGGPQNVLEQEGDPHLNGSSAA
jgi:hypothetical protein